MTTPNIEELITQLRSYSNIGRRVLEEAADALQSQAERIAELELDLDVQAGSIEAVQAVNARQAEHIKELEAENGKLSDLWSAMKAERDTLRAQIAAIAAIEPVGYTDNYGQSYAVKWSGVLAANLTLYATPVAPAPQPAQDVTELVEALEKLARLGNGEYYGNSDGNMIARTALVKYKGAK